MRSASDRPSGFATILAFAPASAPARAPATAAGGGAGLAGSGAGGGALGAGLSRPPAVTNTADRRNSVDKATLALRITTSGLGLAAAVLTTSPAEATLRAMPLL